MSLKSLVGKVQLYWGLQHQKQDCFMAGSDYLVVGLNWLVVESVVELDCRVVELDYWMVGLDCQVVEQ